MQRLGGLIPSLGVDRSYIGKKQPPPEKSKSTRVFNQRVSSDSKVSRSELKQRVKKGGVISFFYDFHFPGMSSRKNFTKKTVLFNPLGELQLFAAGFSIESFSGIFDDFILGLQGESDQITGKSDPLFAKRDFVFRFLSYSHSSALNELVSLIKKEKRTNTFMDVETACNRIRQFIDDVDGNCIQKKEGVNEDQSEYAEEYLEVEDAEHYLNLILQLPYYQGFLDQFIKEVRNFPKFF